MPCVVLLLLLVLCFSQLVPKRRPSLLCLGWLRWLRCTFHNSVHVELRWIHSEAIWLSLGDWVLLLLIVAWCLVSLLTIIVRGTSWTLPQRLKLLTIISLVGLLRLAGNVQTWEGIVDVRSSSLIPQWAMMLGCLEAYISLIYWLLILFEVLIWIASHLRLPVVWSPPGRRSWQPLLDSFIWSHKTV